MNVTLERLGQSLKNFFTYRPADGEPGYPDLVHAANTKIITPNGTVIPQGVELVRYKNPDGSPLTLIKTYTEKGERYYFGADGWFNGRLIDEKR
jgi:hypothetical protein